ncbi:olfactory receptor 1M1-like [Astyanax mexicanus]|uniref:olfactory receptor 1M1-like n=1 Tax=Astyanax mexicanus TaxID=7994 RepID=UPI0020CB3066|nr:olfactory receptor 1M1-like [Astyanax mexicanus]
MMSAQNISVQTAIEFVFRGFDTIQSPLAVGVVLLILYLLVLLSNFVTICFIVMDKRLHQPMYLFVCNLAIVDLVYCTSACPTMIGILIVGYKTISYVLCLMQMFLFHYSGLMEMLAISVMAFDRFVAISSPLRYHSILSNSRCILIAISLWVVGSAIMAVLPATIAPLKICYFNVKYMFCDYATVARATCVDPEPYFNLMSIMTAVVCFGTLSFIFLSYLKIVIVVVKTSSNTDKKKAFNTCVSHLIVIISFYAPSITRIVLTRVGVLLTIEERNGLMILSILGPALINPFVYCLKTKEIRNKIFKIVKKM